MQEVVNTVNAIPATDLSVIGMFLQASFIVKIVMIVLVAASIWSWAIIFAKFMSINTIKKKSNKFEEIFWSCGSIDNLYDSILNNNSDPLIAIFASGMKEFRKYRNYIDINNVTAIQEKICISMKSAALKEVEKIEKYTGFLATVGSTAPFIGLFGTVWGIMNSFEAIGVSQNTNLSSVAPGISEALFATALGLIVTIPAVIAYNKICTEIDRYQNRIDCFIYDFLNVIYLKVCSSASGEDRMYSGGGIGGSGGR